MLDKGHFNVALTVFYFSKLKLPYVPLFIDTLQCNAIFGVKGSARLIIKFSSPK